MRRRFPTLELRMLFQYLLSFNLPLIKRAAKAQRRD